MMECDIYLAIKDFETTRVIDRGFNSSFIILVLKTSDPISLSEYHPISLIGCIYKIIAKVLAERLKFYIPHVVSRTQTNFIKDHNILDVVEGLNIALEEAKEHGIFHGVQLPNNGHILSHLQYIDDAIFLGSWSAQNAKNLVRISRCFELSSGVKVNMAKSKLFGLGVSEVELDWLSRSVNCSIGNLPFIYLGMPMGANEGLDIGSLKAHNLALLGKRWWRFNSRKHELWKDVIKSIYRNDGGFNAPSRAKRKGYCLGSIVNLHNYLSKDNLDLRNLFSQS
uniref:Reverse transcriptase domain-containing protein n=1 Tax=Lactuca sativa TaxID=4236 RepID=A0A9R1V6K1_LACSA|nr:hypothetical protein LSAT_V11C600329490 [Lactuca sativa]